MERYKGYMIAADLDGTLLGSDRHICRRNRDALQRFMDGGGIFTTATGRSVRSVQIFKDELTVNAPIITFNGACLADMESGKVIEHLPLDSGYKKMAAEVMKAFPEVGVEFFTPDRALICQMSEVSRRHFKIIREPVVVTPFEQVPDKITKGLFTQEPEYLKNVLDHIRKEHDGEYAIVASEPFFLEITDKAASKANMVERLADRLGIKLERVFVLGDSLNDLSMVERFTSMVPANAWDEVKEKATYIGCHHDDGIAADLIEIIDTMTA